MGKSKRVLDLIVAKNVTTGNEGFVRLLNDQMAALTAGDTIDDSATIYIEQTLAGGKLYISKPIHGQFVRRYSGVQAANATLQVITVSQPNVIDDQEYGLYITFLSDKDLAFGNRRYYVNYKSDSSATVTEILNGLAAAINASDFKVPVTAANAGTTLTITADRPDVYFSVGKAIGFDSSVTVTTTTTSDPGSGTYDQILALEEIAKGYEGYLSDRYTFMGNLPGFSRPVYNTVGTALSVTGVYDLYVIEHDNPVQMVVPSNLEGKPCTTIIAFPTASTTIQDTFEGLLNPWMGSTPGAFAAVSF